MKFEMILKKTRHGSAEEAAKELYRLELKDFLKEFRKFVCEDSANDPKIDELTEVAARFTRLKESGIINSCMYHLACVRAFRAFKERRLRAAAANCCRRNIRRANRISLLASLNGEVLSEGMILYDVGGGLRYIKHVSRTERGWRVAYSNYRETAAGIVVGVGECSLADFRRARYVSQVRSVKKQTQKKG